MCVVQVLRELDVTWAAMEFEHETHPTRGVTMLKTGDELIETLEENQVYRIPIFYRNLFDCYSTCVP